LALHFLLNRHIRDLKFIYPVERGESPLLLL